MGKKKEEVIKFWWNGKSYRMAKKEMEEFLELAVEEKKKLDAVAAKAAAKVEKATKR